MNLRTLFLPVLLSVAVMSAFTEEPKTVRITVSPETTYVTEPRLSDGRIDYYAAANRENGRGVAPENNLVIALFQVMPGEMEYPLLRAAGNAEALAKLDGQRTYREKFWKELGFDAPPPLEKIRPLEPGLNIHGRDFLKELQSIYTQDEIDVKVKAVKNGERDDYKRQFEAGKIDKEKYEAELKKLDEETPIRISRVCRRVIVNEWIESMEKIWTEKDYPYLARWISTTDDLTQQLIDISKRTDYYCPLIRTGDAVNLYDVPLPYVQAARQAARFFQYRGNWDFGRGDFDRAFECAFSSVRMGRTIRKGGGLIVEDLIGIAMEGMGNFQVSTYLADLGKTKDSAWFLEKKREYDAIYSGIGEQSLPPKSIVMERYGFLSAIQKLAFDPAGFLRENQGFEQTYDSGFDYDWDRILRQANISLDESEDIMSLPSFWRRIRATERLEQRQQTIMERQSGDKNEILSGCFAAVFLPALNAYSQAQCRIEWDHRVTSLAFALAAYRADHEGANPDSLDELVPKYIDSVPLSPYTDKPLRYVKRKNDCLIPNDDHWKLDGSEPDVEKSIADAKSGGRAFPDGRHFVFIVEKLGFR